MTWWLLVDPQDFVLNVALYAPLGLALRRRSFIAALTLGVVLSAVIEVLQVWYLGRYGTLFDVLPTRSA